MYAENAEYPGARLTSTAWRMENVRWSPHCAPPAAFPRAVRRIVMHVTDGGEDSSGVVKWFTEPKSRVSAHFVIGRLGKLGANGDIWQCVPLDWVAWHAGPANADSIGIEHVARSSGVVLPVNEYQYVASARLVRWLAWRYNLTIDSETVIGHSTADPGTTHTLCPGPAWSWSKFMAAVNEVS